MMTLYISGKGLDVKQLELPMPLDELKRQLEAMCPKEGPTDILHIQNIGCPIPGMGWHLQYTKLDSDSVLQKLNQLAEVIGKMDVAGLYHFNNALSTDYAQNLDEILRAARRVKPSDLSSYEFIPDVTTDQALGKWLVEHHRFEISDRLLRHLNYSSVGAEYRSDHEGAFLTNGYTGIQSGAMEQVLEEQSLLRLTLTTSENTFTLNLPATDDRLEGAKRALNLDDFAQATVTSVEFTTPHLKDLIPISSITVEEAQALALCLQDIAPDHDLLMKYCSALAVEDPPTFSEAVSIAMDIDDYECVPEDPAEYGEHNLRLAGAGDEILNMLDGYTDFEQLGKDIMEEEGVRRTEFGLVRRLSQPFPAQEFGQTMS